MVRVFPEMPLLRSLAWVSFAVMSICVAEWSAVVGLQVRLSDVGMIWGW